ncbi:MAG: hypothetical protein K6F52_05910 [Clostridia bacterium]|nr:hypothetical protein [Clostridia bacterium]
MITQLSVFLQNEAGRLEEMTAAIAEAGVNISALCVAETAEYGVMRMIVSDTAKAVEALREKGFTTKLTDVICVETPDVPGELNTLLSKLAAEKINVSYMYGYSDEGTAKLILKVSDPEKAGRLLQNS